MAFNTVIMKVGSFLEINYVVNVNFAWLDEPTHFCFHFETGVKDPSFSNINFRCVGSSLFYVEEKDNEQMYM